jgi:glycosyltransferase involved in cell wall biosynthesis
MAGTTGPSGVVPEAAAGPTVGVLVTVFHRSRFYREALLSVAAQVGSLPEVEVVVVRSPDVAIEVPEPLNTRGWTCRVVRSEAVGEGPFLADGLAALSSDFVVPLDDDDLWVPGRLAAVSEALRNAPRANYYHNGQTFVDAEGGPLPPGVARRYLRRFSGTPSGNAREVSAEQLRRAPSGPARWGSAFNNSSVAIRRSVLVECAEELRSTARLIDAFMFYAGASSGRTLLFDPAPLTGYRIHAWNRSRGPRTLGPFEVAQPSHTREGRLASLAAMRAMVERRGTRWLVPWLEHDHAYFDLLEGLREGEHGRARTIRRAVRLTRYVRYGDPVMNVLLAVTALGLTAAPGVTHRAYWSGDPPDATAPTTGAAR